MTELITHEEARNTMMKIESDDAYYGEFQEEHKLMATYINQQEKKDELLALKDKTINAYQAYLASKDTQDRAMCDKWSNEIIKLLAETFTKEKEIKGELE